MENHAALLSTPICDFFLNKNPKLRKIKKKEKNLKFCK